MKNCAECIEIANRLGWNVIAKEDGQIYLARKLALVETRFPVKAESFAADVKNYAASYAETQKRMWGKAIGNGYKWMPDPCELAVEVAAVEKLLSELASAIE